MGETFPPEDPNEHQPDDNQGEQAPPGLGNAGGHYAAPEGVLGNQTDEHYEDPTPDSPNQRQYPPPAGDVE